MERAPIIFDFKDIGKIFFSMLLSFLVAKILIQTDLIMLAPLGEKALAAFAIPSRVMFIDMIAAFAISPVVSVIVSSEKVGNERKIVIQRSLSFSIYLSIILMILGLLIYPIIVRHIVKDLEVSHLAILAVVWMTIAIPIRFTQSICTMILFGCQRGNVLYPIFAVAIVINALFDWLLIYHLRIGFAGSYLATIITSCLQLAWSLYVLRSDAPLFTIFQLPPFSWVKNFIGCMSAELGRVVSWQFVSFAILIILASNVLWVPMLSVYSVATEFYLLLLVPMIVIMRSIAIFLAPHATLESNELYYGFKKIIPIGIFIVILFAILLVIFRYYIGSKIYHFDQAVFVWWSAFVWTTAILLPIVFFNSIQRGIWQSRKQYKFIFILELILTWPIALLTIYYGLHLNNPWIMWSGNLLVETTICIILYLAKKRLDVKKELYISTILE